MEKLKEYTILFLHLVYAIVLATIISYFLISFLIWDFNIALWPEGALVVFRALGALVALILFIIYLHSE